MEANATVSTRIPQGKNPNATQEALTRAVSGQSCSNFPAIFAGFAAKGIPESEIEPRENVFTFNAWKALGRVVASMGSRWLRLSITLVACTN